jgi:hypothetical protein
MMKNMTKRGLEKMVNTRISRALGNSPDIRQVLYNEELETSIGHWKTKIVESGLFGQCKKDEDQRVYFSRISKEADIFLLIMFKGLKPWGPLPINDDGGLNLNFKINLQMTGYVYSNLEIFYRKKAAENLYNKFNLSEIAKLCKEKRKDKTFKELKNVLMSLVDSEILSLTVFGRNTLGMELLNDVLPYHFFGNDYDLINEDTGELNLDFLEKEIEDSELEYINVAIKDLLMACYDFNKTAKVQAYKVLDLIVPNDEERVRILSSIGIKS